MADAAANPATAATGGSAETVALPAHLADWRPADIAGHALISDCMTGALVYRDGTIDWLCMPDFDSQACMASLIGNGGNGGWWLAPTGEVQRVSRSYSGDSLILETVHETAGGTVGVIDFMPADRGQAPDIVRIVEGRAGEVELVSDIVLRFSDGYVHPLAHEHADGGLVAIAGPDAVVIDAEVPIEIKPGHFTSRFTVREGESVAFVVTWFPSFEPPPQRVDARTALEETTRFWSGWADRCSLDGESRDRSIRSLLTLKALTHSRTGGMIAALTASLPETPGGSRNWDYRFCWLRDAAFALLALLDAGYREEARAWISWLRRALAGQPIDLRPFYRINGGRLAAEHEIDWLDGFGGARPVRFGNAASGQLQLDVYGEAIDALFIAWKTGLDGDDELIRLLAEQVESNWTDKDDGIWESRGEQQHHTYSKAMCWVAFDRMAQFADSRGEGNAAHWRELAERVRAEALERGFHPGINAFTQTYGSDRLDASVLRMPGVGFIAADDPRMVGTVAAIERELMHDGFVWRYKADGYDGLEGAEGSFLAATCWLADVYAAQGRHDDARATFERVAAAANDLGLLSEEYLPSQSLQLGNFPQALSHVAMVTTARAIFGTGAAPPAERGGEVGAA